MINSIEISLALKWRRMH